MKTIKALKLKKQTLTNLAASELAGKQGGHKTKTCPRTWGGITCGSKCPGI